MYCVAFIHIHSSHTNVTAPSILNTESVRVVSFSHTYFKSMQKSECIYCIISHLLPVF